MQRDVKETVREWLENDVVDLFLGYRMMDGHVLPHAFVKNRLEEADDIVSGPVRYPLEKLAAEIAAKHPEVRIGLLVRDCNQRALNVLAVWNRIDPGHVKTLNLNCCPSKLIEHGDCSYLEPTATGPYKRQVGIDNNMAPQDLESYDPGDRIMRWMYEFQKCIKCYGCRNICPVCFCKDCSLEHPELIETGELPPEFPIFHLTRAVHMAGRCIDCGLCEDACPADIPLRLLYRKVNEIVKDVFDYQTGTSPDQSPFNVLGDQVTLEPRPIGTA